MGRDFRYEPVGERNFHYEGLHRKLWSVRLNLSGPHQFINATTALGAMEVLEDLGYPVSTEAMMEGLRDVRWPGRLEMVSSSPRVILDGAHNPAGALVLRESLEEEFQFNRLILLMGIMKDKDIKSILQTLAPLADHIILSRPHTERASSPSQLLESLGDKWEERQRSSRIFPGPSKRGLSMTQKEDLLCITGSLYTVGEARDYFLSRGRIMKAFRISPHFFLHLLIGLTGVVLGKSSPSPEGACG